MKDCSGVLLQPQNKMLTVLTSHNFFEIWYFDNKTQNLHICLDLLRYLIGSTHLTGYVFKTRIENFASVFLTWKKNLNNFDR